MPSFNRISTRPPVMVAPSYSVSRMIVIAVTDFPDPDSPTSATVSPRAMRKETPRTARSSARVWAAKQTSRSSTERMTSSGSSGVADLDRDISTWTRLRGDVASSGLATRLHPVNMVEWQGRPG
ncbi:hypothetical protein D9M70_537610 [compost metagenome]